MIGQLLILGITLSLDNFRTAIVLGALRLSWRHSAQVAVVFGFWDTVAPLVGILGGEYFAETIGSTAEPIGAAVLAGYGLYLVVQAWRTPAAEEVDQRWALFGLPLPLSVDNVAAGATLGLLVMVSAPLTGAGFNPARAFGPDLVANAWGGGGKFLLVYVLAPLIGAVLAAFTYMRMFVLPGKKGPFGMGPVG